MHTHRVTVALGLLLFLFDTTAQSTRYAYPLDNQSPEQQRQDEGACHQWAQQRTGVNPNVPPPQAQLQYAPPPPTGGVFGTGNVGQGGMMRDGARGAALGAVGGAIAGDAGKGAAIGAASGALFGAMRRVNRQQQEQQWQAQQQQQYAQQQEMLNSQYEQGLSNFYNAWSACMAARRYQVQ